MFRGTLVRKSRWTVAAATIALAVIATAVAPHPAIALITGGEGNMPLNIRGLPAGAATIFDHSSRIAWWEGPPFGGGQWHAEYRGDAKTLNALIAKFAKLDVKLKRVVIHEGAGHSFWLGTQRHQKQPTTSEIDWAFTAWQAENWARLRKLPRDLGAIQAGPPDESPPVQIDVYLNGKLRWADLVIPPGVEVRDERPSAHGFTAADGFVLEGSVVDLANKEPIPATIRLQRIEPRAGGYDYPVVVSTAADDRGRWVLKNVPDGPHRVVVDAAGYVPRVVGHASSGGQPGWSQFESGLSKSATLSGRVTDAASKPLEDVKVRIADLGSDKDGRYEIAHECAATTDADGRFRIDQVPIGEATIRLRKSGYCQPGLLQPIAVPAADVVLSMPKSSRLTVTVDFGEAVRPAQYLVNIEPEGGNAVGKWGGSSQIKETNQVTFNDVPPGRYVLQGQPNPSSDAERSRTVTIELKGGESLDVNLSAR